MFESRICVALQLSNKYMPAGLKPGLRGPSRMSSSLPLMSAGSRAQPIPGRVLTAPCAAARALRVMLLSSTFLVP